MYNNILIYIEYNTYCLDLSQVSHVMRASTHFTSLLPTPHHALGIRGSAIQVQISCRQSMLVTLTSGVVTTIAQCSVTKVAAKDVWNLDIRDGDGISLATLMFHCLHILVSLGNQLLPFYIWLHREHLESVSARMTALQ